MSAPRVIAGAAAAAFVAGALGAFASGVVSADDTTPTATVCVGPDGQLRHDEDGCRRPETQLTIVGEQGPQGEPGPKGD
jgi:hypothetical protein